MASISMMLLSRRRLRRTPWPQTVAPTPLKGPTFAQTLAKLQAPPPVTPQRRDDAMSALIKQTLLNREPTHADLKKVHQVVADYAAALGELSKSARSAAQALREKLTPRA